MRLLERLVVRGGRAVWVRTVEGWARLPGRLVVCGGRAVWVRTAAGLVVSAWRAVRVRPAAA